METCIELSPRGRTHTHVLPNVMRLIDVTHKTWEQREEGGAVLGVQSHSEVIRGEASGVLGGSPGEAGDPCPGGIGRRSGEWWVMSVRQGHRGTLRAPAELDAGSSVGREGSWLGGLRGQWSWNGGPESKRPGDGARPGEASGHHGQTDKSCVPAGTEGSGSGDDTE